MSEFCAVIPARGGSKRIPGKNLRHFGTKPLVAHTIEAALESRVFDAIYVSTDSPPIAEAAGTYDDIVVLERPSDLADDLSTAVDVTVDVLMHHDSAAYVAQLLPTSPLRTGDDVAASHRMFMQSPDRSLVSVAELLGYNAWWSCVIDDDAMSFLHDEALAFRSQDLPTLAIPTGALAWASSDLLRASPSFYALDPRPYTLPFDRGIDIDSPSDWKLAEQLMAVS